MLRNWEFFHGPKTIKHSFATSADFEDVFQITDNSTYKSFTTEESKHKPCGLKTSLKYAYDFDEKILKAFIIVAMIVFIDFLKTQRKCKRYHKIQTNRIWIINC